MNDEPTTRVSIAPDGTWTVLGMPPLLAWALRELPSLLADDADGIDERICPSPYPDDPEKSEEWRRLNEPELAHLFRSARELVTEDLGTLAYEPGGFTIRIPEDHRTAWISALAAARVAKGDALGVDADDMDRPLDSDLHSVKDRVVLLIHLLGWMQGLLVEGPDGGSIGA